MNRTVKIPCGRDKVAVTIPDDIAFDVVRPNSYPALDETNLEELFREAVAHPLGCRPLAESVKPTDTVCIAVTDITRICPDDLILKVVTSELLRLGVPKQNITIIVGVGMHRASTPAEKLEMFGAEIVRDFRIIDHEAQNPAQLVDLGLTANGVPVVVNKTAYECDFLMATGVVEPHQYAGYSGCRKTLAIGCGGEPTIGYTHGVRMVDHPDTKIGNIESNPFDLAIKEIAKKARLKFVVNVVYNGDKKICKIAAGAPDDVFTELVATAKEVYTVGLPKQYDAAICGVGYPKDANLYQATRAASYMHFSFSPVVKPGGAYVIPAPCQEGAGDGVGEQRFFETMRRASDARQIVEDARRDGYQAGEQRAFIVGKVLEQNDIIVLGAEQPEVISQAKMIPVPDYDGLWDLLRRRAQGKPIALLVVPAALLTLVYYERR